MDTPKPQPTSPTREEIAAQAYQYWVEEGHPPDKADEHWLRAEEELGQWETPEPPEGEAGLPPSA